MAGALALEDVSELLLELDSLLELGSSGVEPELPQATRLNRLLIRQARTMIDTFDDMV
jgi:hypothetical protein|tara:strand:+ start:158 stop:331 length:174 start_codon:yes stop_codon:yes gene_type:complete